jgi:hypothetical protein
MFLHDTGHPHLVRSQDMRDRPRLSIQRKSRLAHTLVLGSGTAWDYLSRTELSPSLKCMANIEQ